MWYCCHIFSSVSNGDGGKFLLAMCSILFHSSCLFVGIKVADAFWLIEIGKLLFLYSIG